VEQELLTLPEHLSSPPVFSGVRVTRSLVLYVCFVDRCLSFCTFSFGPCVVCSSSIYGFWLPLWYLQTLLDDGVIKNNRKSEEDRQYSDQKKNVFNLHNSSTETVYNSVQFIIIDSTSEHILYKKQLKVTDSLFLIYSRYFSLRWLCMANLYVIYS